MIKQIPRINVFVRDGSGIIDEQNTLELLDMPDLGLTYGTNKEFQEQLAQDSSRYTHVLWTPSPEQIVDYRQQKMHKLWTREIKDAGYTGLTGLVLTQAFLERPTYAVLEASGFDPGEHHDIVMNFNDENFFHDLEIYFSMRRP